MKGQGTARGGSSAGIDRGKRAVGNEDRGRGERKALEERASR
jgi:hypothetical protein